MIVILLKIIYTIMTGKVNIDTISSALFISKSSQNTVLETQAEKATKYTIVHY